MFKVLRIPKLEPLHVSAIFHDGRSAVGESKLIGNFERTGEQTDNVPQLSFRKNLVLHRVVFIENCGLYCSGWWISMFYDVIDPN